MILHYNADLELKEKIPNIHSKYANILSCLIPWSFHCFEMLPYPLTSEINLKLLKTKPKF